MLPPTLADKKPGSRLEHLPIINHHSWTVQSTLHGTFKITIVFVGFFLTRTDWFNVLRANDNYYWLQIQNKQVKQNVTKINTKFCSISQWILMWGDPPPPASTPLVQCSGHAHSLPPPQLSRRVQRSQWRPPSLSSLSQSLTVQSTSLGLRGRTTIIQQIEVTKIEHSWWYIYYYLGNKF